MMLLTKQNRADLPKLDYNADGTESPMVHVKLFDPSGRMTYYVTEFDGEDQLFGYMISPLGPDCDEWGYSSLAELSAVRGRFGLGIERDRHFVPTTVARLKETGRIPSESAGAW